MHSYIASHYDQFLQDLETLVNVDSGSGHAPGLRRSPGSFRSALIGLDGTPGRWNRGGAAPCLEVVNRKGHPATDRFDFLFLGHMDTVFPAGTARQRPFSIRDGRAWGPGVCDMKAGLVTALHAAEALQHAGVADDLSVCIAFNSDEEIGSRASRPWFEGLAAKSRRVLVFEPCRSTGQRVLQRKGVADFDILCHGRAAHAGVEPEKGANAVLELAHQVLAVTGFARPPEGTTVSVTTIAGGTAGNVIPDFAQAGFDVRIASIEEGRRIEASFRNISVSGKADGVRVEVRGEINRMPMVPSEATWRLWEQIARIGESLGLEMKLISTGGGRTAFHGRFGDPHRRRHGAARRPRPQRGRIPGTRQRGPQHALGLRGSQGGGRKPPAVRVAEDARPAARCSWPQPFLVRRLHEIGLNQRLLVGE